MLGKKHFKWFNLQLWLYKRMIRIQTNKRTIATSNELHSNMIIMLVWPKSQTSLIQSKCGPWKEQRTQDFLCPPSPSSIPPPPPPESKWRAWQWPRTWRQQKSQSWQPIKIAVQLLIIWKAPSGSHWSLLGGCKPGNERQFTLTSWDNTSYKTPRSSPPDMTQHTSLDYSCIMHLVAEEGLMIS